MSRIANNPVSIPKGVEVTLLSGQGRQREGFQRKPFHDNARVGCY